MKLIAQLMNREPQIVSRKPKPIADKSRYAECRGKIMPSDLKMTLVLLVLCCAFPAKAAETGAIKCGVNEDRVWVYDSLNSFDVALKLKCGEPVEIISREKGYVKIRTSGGKEGYVPEKALPKPPEAKENSQNSSEAQPGSQQEPQTVAAAARAKTPSNGAPSAGAKTPEHTSVAVNPTKTASASPSKTQAAPKIEAVSTPRVAAKASSIKDASVSNTPAANPAPLPAAPTNNIELADNRPSESAALSGSVHIAASPRDPDDEEYPVVKSVENSETCRIYFSAYGLSPNQYKWMTRNRGKGFSGICPAPAPAMVDFVVIFTHDVDFYNGTMPTPVHTDKNGFSDFTPLTTVDSAVVSPSDADKNRREYVWVFHTKRGTFDPAKFSPKRRPLFSTTESNKLGTAAGSRSAEDALRYIEQHGVDR